MQSQYKKTRLLDKQTVKKAEEHSSNGTVGLVLCQTATSPNKTVRGMQINQRIQVLRLTQWLDAWNTYDFDPNEQGRKPDSYIHLDSI